MLKVQAGLVGHGSSFVARDPSGIRPLFYYANDEVVVATSERPPIKTAFQCDFSEIKEVEPGHALIIDKDGSYSMEKFIEPRIFISITEPLLIFSPSTTTSSGSPSPPSSTVRIVCGIIP